MKYSDSTNEICEILNIEKEYCDTNKNGISMYKYHYKAKTIKCLNMELNSLNNVLCQYTTKYNINHNYNCWVLNCNDNEFALENPAKSERIGSSIFSLLCGWIFSIPVCCMLRVCCRKYRKFCTKCRKHCCRCGKIAFL